MNYLTLFLLILFASAFVQEVRGSSVIKMSIGTTITLPSEADISLPLSSIEWYIFNNKTFIAVFFKPDVKEDMYPPLKGRLSLNTTTGNLEIRDLTLEDSRTYMVETKNTHNEPHTNEVTLSVLERLPEPTLKEINSTRANGLCWVSLNCSVSTSREVMFKWSPDPLPRGCHWELQHNQTTLKAPAAVRSAWCSPNRTVTIHCTASDSMSNTNSTKSINCSATKKNKDNPQKVDPPNRTGLIFIGIFIGVPIGLMMFYFKGKWSNWRKPTQTKGEHEKSTQTEQGLISSTQYEAVASHAVIPLCPIPGGAEKHNCNPSESNDGAFDPAAYNKEEDLPSVV